MQRLLSTDDLARLSESFFETKKVRDGLDIQIGLSQTAAQSRPISTVIERSHITCPKLPLRWNSGLEQGNQDVRSDIRFLSHIGLRSGWYSLPPRWCSPSSTAQHFSCSCADSGRKVVIIIRVTQARPTYSSTVTARQRTSFLMPLFLFSLSSIHPISSPHS